MWMQISTTHSEEQVVDVVVDVIVDVDGRVHNLLRRLLLPAQRRHNSTGSSPAGKTARCSSKCHQRGNRSG
jgi:hypothetical protein